MEEASPSPAVASVSTGERLSVDSLSRRTYNPPELGMVAACLSCSRYCYLSGESCPSVSLMRRMRTLSVFFA